MPVTNTLRPIERLPDLKQPSRRSFAIVRVGGVPRPESLEHARALGSPIAVGAPGNLDHGRALGDISIANVLRVKVLSGTRLRASWSISRVDSRAVFYLQAQLPQPGNLEHGRFLGTLHVARNPLPAGLEHIRALGAITVSTPINPLPSGLLHERLLGSLVTVIAQAPPPAPIIYGRRTLPKRRPIRW